MIENKNKMLNQKTVSRRGFLKKAAYTAPVFVPLGHLALPESAYADGSGGPPGPPGGFLAPASSTTSPSASKSKKHLNI